MLILFFHINSLCFLLPITTILLPYLSISPYHQQKHHSSTPLRPSNSTNSSPPIPPTSPAPNTNCHHTISTSFILITASHLRFTSPAIIPFSLLRPRFPSTTANSVPSPYHNLLHFSSPATSVVAASPATKPTSVSHLILQFQAWTAAKHSRITIYSSSFHSPITRCQNPPAS